MLSMESNYWELVWPSLINDALKRKYRVEQGKKYDCFFTFSMMFFFFHEGNEDVLTFSICSARQMVLCLK